MKKHTCLLLLTAFLIVNPVFAQNELDPQVWRDYFPASPEASKMPRYVEPTVNYNRGVVDISIPLYVIEVDDISLPIVLTYNHKGIKFSETNSVVGLGWDLQAEPKVVRSVNGAPDEKMVYKSLAVGEKTQDKLHAFYVSRGSTNDGLPDQYYYSLLGKGGSYILRPYEKDQPLTAIPIPYEPIKIECDGENDLISITDENGFYYNFGGEATETFNSYSSVWKATKVLAPNGIDEVTFDYLDGGRKEIFQLNDIYSIIYNTKLKEQKLRISNYDGNYGIWTYDIVSETPAPGHITLKYNRTGRASIGSTYGSALRYSHPIHINTIKHKYGEMSFIYTNNVLEKIEVTDQDDSKRRTIHLYHSSVSGESYSILDSVIIKDKSDQTMDSYKMTYNSPYPRIKNNEKFVNFWGYFTGLKNSTASSPFLNAINVEVLGFSGAPQIRIPGQSMEVGASMEGILTSMTNSLGLKTQYFYGNDKYIKIEADGTAVPVSDTGGCRIQRIEYTDALTDEKIIRKIQYGPSFTNSDFSETGNGVVRRNITPDAYMYEQQIQNLWSETQSFFTMHTYTSSLFGNWTLGGDPVVYDRVTEYRSIVKNGTEVQEGKTVYTYNYPLDSDRQWYDSDMLKEISGTNLVENKMDSWKYGQLLSKTEYDQYGKVASRVTYTYERVTPPLSLQPLPLDVWQIYKQTLYWEEAKDPADFGRKLMESSAYSPYLLYEYPIGTGAIRLAGKSEYFPGSNAVSSTTTYSYGNREHMFPTTIVTTYADQLSPMTKKVKYVQDDTSSGDAAHVTARNELLQKGIITPVIEEDISVGNFRQINSTRYKIFDNKPLPHKMITQREGNSAEERAVIHEYDYYGNPLYTTQDGTNKVVYIWSYQGKHPVAVIENVTYDEVKTALNSLGADSDFFNTLSKKRIPSTADWTKLEGLRTAITKSHVSIFYYDDFTGNLCWASDARGVKMYYDYDSAGRLIKTYYKEKNSSGVEEERVIETYEYNFRNL